MPSFTLATVSTTERVLSPGEIGIIGPDGVLVADTDDGITAIGGGSGRVTIQVLGAILPSFRASIDIADTALTLFVGANGYISAAAINSISYSAVIVSNTPLTTEIINQGTIQAESFAVYVGNALAGADLDLANSGLISGASGAVFYSGLGTALVHNSGTMAGESSCLQLLSSEENRIENTGTIRGLGTAIQTGAGNDALVNRGEVWGNVSTSSGNELIDNRTGRIEGDLLMGTGDDTLDNRDGTIFGDIDMGDGLDTFRPGLSEEVADGGAGTDTLDFRGGTGVTVALDESLPNTGAAAGDDYAGFESILGSYAADLLVGSAGANTLRGYGGNDTLNGGAGSDKIVGGNGIDTATGGAGSDTFVFDKLSETGDVITDFDAGADAFNIRASAFGGGLVAGPLAAAQFQSRADNTAQDGNDRFIFRTTDRTLWFDADGNGGGAAVMVADLQAGATMTAADILLI